jgi:Uma2 family endonuclease
MVEVLAPGETNKERDRELKRKLYARRGVQEYWILDWRETTIQVYRRESDALQLADTLTSPPLPGFSWPVGALLATPL